MFDLSMPETKKPEITAWEKQREQERQKLLKELQRIESLDAILPTRRAAIASRGELIGKLVQISEDHQKSHYEMLYMKNETNLLLALLVEGVHDLRKVIEEGGK